ncbi:hypothetical protein EGW08_019444 [Elysia chlorotica]|uniref:Ig-like domain-containing protein n=1 Tax=Elysia chlorotica TaxID=188477 RepID=A0A3S1H5R8_ELYCH|nr:hypothetical protein EGW08_019444 [Elysia chlorotica]
MKNLIFTILLVLVTFTADVLAQSPEIVDQIWPEVQPIGRTARINCTVAKLKENSVEWYHVDSRQTISVLDSILVENPMIGSLKKYDVMVRNENDRVTFMLVIRRLRQQDSGTYKCIVRIQNGDQSSWPTKLGSLTVQALIPSYFCCRCEATPKEPLITVMLLFCVRALKFDYPHVFVVWFRRSPVTLVFSLLPLPVNFYNRYLICCCCVAGHPQPTVTWERKVDNGRFLINDDDKFDINKQTTDNQNLKAMEQWYSLKVKNVQANDFTSYYCRAGNKYGNHSSRIDLFETTECQGSNCPSLPPSAASHITASITFLLVIVMFSNRLFNN